MKMNSMYFAALLFAGAFINTSIGQESFPAEVIVKFEQQPTPQSLLDVEQALDTDVQWTTLQHAPHAKGLPNQPHPLSFFRIANVDLLDIEGNINELVNSVAAVSYICLNVTAEPASTVQPYTPDDPIFVDPMSVDDRWALEAIDAKGAWGITTGNPDIVIAIIDSGCRISHEDLQANIWVNDEIPNNGIDDDNNGFVDDVNGWNFLADNNSIEDDDFFRNDLPGHGTQASGIAAGRIDNGIGTAGVSNAKIMTVKWIGATNAGDCGAAQSIFYAVDNGAHVLSLSWGFFSFAGEPVETPITEAAINYAHANGVTVVAAMGNAVLDGNRVYYPASDPQVIAVGAIDSDLERADFSNIASYIDVVAPGVDVLTPSPSSDSSYVPFSGTSSATPHVAGLVALMLSADPTLTPAEIQSAIKANADDSGTTGFDDSYGHGRINVANTLASVATLGDVDRNGIVNFMDLQPFIDLLVAQEYQFEADIDCDGSVNFFDISPFISLLAGS